LLRVEINRIEEAFNQRYQVKRNLNFMVITTNSFNTWFGLSSERKVHFASAFVFCVYYGHVGRFQHVMFIFNWRAAQCLLREQLTKRNYLPFSLTLYTYMYLILRIQLEIIKRKFSSTWLFLFNPNNEMEGHSKSRYFFWSE